MVGFGLAWRQCTRPNPLLDPGDETAGERFNDCVAAAPYIAILRVASDIGLATTMGLAAGGGAVRGRRDAYLHVVRGVSPALRRRAIALTATGGVLVAAGAVLYATTRLWVFTRYLLCPTEECVQDTMAMNLGIREATFLFGAVGGGLAGWGIAELVHEKRYRGHEIALRPLATPTLAGLSIGGRF
jgi:hypothetical protein